MYEPEKHHWTYFKPHEGRNEAKDCGRARHSVLLYENSLYLFGGICKHGFTTNKLFRLDLQKDLQVSTGSNGISDPDHLGSFSWRQVSPHSKRLHPHRSLTMPLQYFPPWKNTNKLLLANAYYFLTFVIVAPN